MSDQLLRRLRDYVEHAHARGKLSTVYPVATTKLLTESESALGFPLNQFLRDVYLKVANGGFGPTYGLIGLPGGAPDDLGFSIIETHRQLSRFFGTQWPSRLVPICHHGCGILACIDCSNTDGAITTWHPGLFPEDPARWSENFVPEAPSIIDWFTRWLDSEDAKH